MISLWEVDADRTKLGCCKNALNLSVTEFSQNLSPLWPLESAGKTRRSNLILLEDSFHSDKWIYPRGKDKERFSLESTNHIHEIGELAGRDGASRIRAMEGAQGSEGINGAQYVTMFKEIHFAISVVSRKKICVLLAEIV